MRRRFKDPIVSALVNLRDRLTTVTLSRMTALVQAQNAGDIVSAKLFLELFRGVLYLRRWLQSEGTYQKGFALLALTAICLDAAPPHFGPALASRLIPALKRGAIADADVCLVVLSIVQEEFSASPESDPASQLGAISAVYMSFRAFGKQDGEATCHD